MTTPAALWLDAHLSPALAKWVNEHVSGVDARSFRALGLRTASDGDAFAAARAAGAIVMTKDADFRAHLERHGPPPQVIWVTCGNTSNARMREVLNAALPGALALLRAGESLVEITGR